MKTSAIISGILVIAIFIFILEVMLTSDVRNNIIMSDNLCNAEGKFFGINLPIGKIGQSALDKYEECRTIHYYRLLVDYGWIGYLIGTVLILFGFFERVPKENNKKIIRREYEEEREEKIEEDNKNKKRKYCINCGCKLGGYEKHCYNCGKKINRN